MQTSIYTAATRTDAADTTPEERRNGTIHIASLVASKLGDGLIDPKLVLAWLLGALGAPGAAIGALVPVREAGALLPQLPLAARLSGRRRKWMWATGAAGQGLAALAIALAALTLTGAAAGWTILACLGAFSLARAAASVSHKDALARTVPKARRGSVSGLASSVAAAGVLVFGLLLWADVIPTRPTAIAAIVALGGGLLLCAGAAFTRLAEPDPDPSETAQAPRPAELAAPIATDPQLRRLVAARALLAVTALAPPFLVMLSAQEGRDTLADLGPLVLAAAAASIVSGHVWGRLSDRSSRMTLVAGGVLGAATFAAAGAAGALGGAQIGAAATAAAVFVGQIAYEGVRAGRKLHLTDMAPDSERARYTAVANTLVGGALLAGGAAGALADAAGAAVVLVMFAAIALAGAAVSLSLREVQADAA